ncbi:gamma-glutamyl hydrolase [Halyomorpha halys]|uniref:gamma-glutamyl hydrolase n=1 Tax=Halyomorpha halys TaxID=286706 RepID=UPI0006D4EC51|nr:gamma-glutamyl hydrolase-like [Halyomorpha halys]
MAFAAASLSFLLLSLVLQVAQCTDRPIIGILTQEFSKSSSTLHGTSYIAASYVKAVEGSGARAVPIFLKKPISYYRDLLYKLNGALLPGGAAPFHGKGGYFESAARIYAIGKEMERQGIKFPILGVCQGFEALAVVSNNMETDTLTRCNGMDHVMLPLEFQAGFKNSSLYGDASDDIINTLTTMNVTANYHQWCLRPSVKLREPWRILSLNKDANGLEFVSSMENGNFAGVQFHPEKCAYEWTKENPSFKKALLAARHFYDWLVSEARLNDNHFPTPEEENNYLIYNFSPEFSGKNGSIFEQIYFF